LVERGFPVDVLTTADQEARGLAGRCRIVDGVRIDYLRVLRQRHWTLFRRVDRLQAFARGMNRLLRDFSFHLGIAWRIIRASRRGDVLQWYVVGDFAWPVFQLAHWLGRRNLIQISLIGADDPASFRRTFLGLSTALKRRCFFRADAVVGLSRALTDSCLDAGVPAEQVRRIPNGVDLVQFAAKPRDRAPLCDQLGLDPQRRYIVFVGSAIQRKGIDVAIPAFIELAGYFPDIDLLVVGQCDFSDATRHPAERRELLERLRNQLRDASRATRVHWCGLQDNVADYLRVGELFFFPTRREGLPNAVAEAMACGLPVVASRLPGITTDLIEDGVEGQLVDGFDPSDYARALKRLLANPRELEAMSHAARQRIEREFGLPHVITAYARLYEHLC
jgi:glycosyltransferase involved in cell wall biosynthesis